MLQIPSACSEQRTTKASPETPRLSRAALCLLLHTGTLLSPLFKNSHQGGGEPGLLTACVASRPPRASRPIPRAHNAASEAGGVHCSPALERSASPTLPPANESAGSRAKFLGCLAIGQPISVAWLIRGVETSCRAGRPRCKAEGESERDPRKGGEAALASPRSPSTHLGVPPQVTRDHPLCPSLWGCMSQNPWNDSQILLGRLWNPLPPGVPTSIKYVGGSKQAPPRIIDHRTWHMHGI